MPYFALEGDFRILSKDPNFNDFFPNFEPPRTILYTNEKETMNLFKKCYVCYNSGQFLLCAKQSEALLEKWPQKNNSASKLAVLFIHVWIINSFFALNRPDCVLPYIKQLNKIFSNYPWIVGLSSFYFLKHCIYSGNYKHYIDPPPLAFESIASWNHVISFHSAIECLKKNVEDCFQFFEEIRECSNVLIKREAFHYVAGAYRLFGINPCISDFENECKTCKEARALYIYHSCIDYINDDDIDAAWNFIKPVNVDDSVLQALYEAEQIASGHCATIRKIKLLQAILICLLYTSPSPRD